MKSLSNKYVDTGLTSSSSCMHMSECHSDAIALQSKKSQGCKSFLGWTQQPEHSRGTSSGL